MRVVVRHTIDDLASDLATIARSTPTTIVRTVRTKAKEGNDLAKGFARASSGKHARKYPGTFSVGAASVFYGFGGGSISVEYGPEHRGQGELAPILERGSRNNPAHMNLDKSADIIADTFGPAVLDAVDDLFWPES